MSRRPDRKQRAALERIVRGFSNHRRIQILYILLDQPNLGLTAIAAGCMINLQTAAEHTRRLSESGLVMKRKRGREVLHSVSPLGNDVIQFLDSCG